VLSLKALQSLSPSGNVLLKKLFHNSAGEGLNVTQDIDLDDDDDDEDDDSIPFSFDDVGFSVSPDFRLVEMLKKMFDTDALAT
jgi:hypothetical protein